MAINIAEQNGKVPYDMVSLVVDTDAEVASLPKDYAPGSSAICAATGKVYILNGNREWKEI